jgi:CheY-like chemotaxis protein
MEPAALPIDNRESPIRLLVADDDPFARALLASGARGTLGAIVVLEAEDGAEAIQLGLQHRPAIAVLDVDLPRLGGIEAATTLRELRPGLRVALQAEDLRRCREPAHAQGLPLFPKRSLDHALAWLDAQIAHCTTMPLPSEAADKLSLRCSRCGYGVMRAIGPERCPMCHAQSDWIPASRPSTRALARA